MKRQISPNMTDPQHLSEDEWRRYLEEGELQEIGQDPSIGLDLNVDLTMAELDQWLYAHGQGLDVTPDAGADHENPNLAPDLHFSSQQQTPEINAVPDLEAETSTNERMDTIERQIVELTEK